MKPTLSKISIYPIKSLDPVELSSVKIGTRSLLGDRRYAMLTHEGGFINGKRTGLVNQLQASYDDALQHVTLRPRGSSSAETFNLATDVKEIEKYLSAFFNMKVHFLLNETGRLMDIPDESSVTVVATETLTQLATALNEPIDTLRLRFRCNIEIANVPPYWEEQLAQLTAGPGIRFKIGDVEIRGVSLRARCNVPPRNPFTGETDKSFIKRMLASRQATVPEWSHVRELGSLYHLTLNTFVPDSEKGKEIKTGDIVVVN